MSRKLRRLSFIDQRGVDKFISWFNTGSNNKKRNINQSDNELLIQNSDSNILEDILDNHSYVVSDKSILLDQKEFNNKLDFIKYLVYVFDKEEDDRINHDVKIFNFLLIYFFEQLKDNNNTIDFYTISEKGFRYRNKILPFFIFYKKFPHLNLPFVGPKGFIPIYGWGEIPEQLFPGLRYRFPVKSVMELYERLFYSATTNSVKNRSSHAAEIPSINCDNDHSYYRGSGKSQTCWAIRDEKFPCSGEPDYQNIKYDGNIRELNPLIDSIAKSHNIEDENFTSEDLLNIVNNLNPNAINWLNID